MNNLDILKNEIKELYKEKFELEKKMNKIEQTIQEKIYELDSKCNHDRVPDRSYVGERTVWTCIKCGL